MFTVTLDEALALLAAPKTRGRRAAGAAAAGDGRRPGHREADGDQGRPVRPVRDRRREQRVAAPRADAARSSPIERGQRDARREAGQGSGRRRRPRRRPPAKKATAGARRRPRRRRRHRGQEDDRREEDHRGEEGRPGQEDRDRRRAGEEDRPEEGAPSRARVRGLVVDRQEAGGISWESARRPPDPRLAGLVADVMGYAEFADRPVARRHRPAPRGHGDPQPRAADRRRRHVVRHVRRPGCTTPPAAPSSRANSAASNCGSPRRERTGCSGSRPVSWPDGSSSCRCSTGWPPGSGTKPDWGARLALARRGTAEARRRRPGARPGRPVGVAGDARRGTAWSGSPTSWPSTGWSRRHFAARFRAGIGLPPKVAARMLRFHRASRLLANGVPAATVSAGLRLHRPEPPGARVPGAGRLHAGRVPRRTRR